MKYFFNMEYFPKRMNIPQEAFNTFSAETLAFAQKLIQTPSLSGHENNVANLISDKMQTGSGSGKWLSG